MNKKHKPKVTIFYCINSFNENDYQLFENELEIKTVKMACSSMVKDVFLLRAFESGADAVIVLVCPPGACRYVEGNIRAQKRVAWVKNLLDEIGINGQRLSIHNISLNDRSTVENIMRQTLTELGKLGRNPAAKN